METLAAQAFAFAFMLASGVILGLLFDFYRVTRGILRPGAVLTRVGDLLFWAVMTAVAFALLLRANWGQLRFYVVLGWLAGASLYYWLFSRWFIRLAFTLLAGARSLLREGGRRAWVSGLVFWRRLWERWRLKSK